MDKPISGQPALMPIVDKCIENLQPFLPFVEFASKVTALDAEFRVRDILQEAVKFMKHGKRTLLTTDDIDHALKLRYFKITPKKNINPFRNYLETYPTHRESKESDIDEDAMVDVEGFEEEDVQIQQKLLDPDSVIDAALPKQNENISMGIHWLAVDGTQTQIPENPLSVEEKILKPQNITFSIENPIPPELQLYYDRVTSAMKLQEESIINATLDSIKNDNGGINHVVPFLSQFVVEEIMNNLRNLQYLKLLIRMIRAIVENDKLQVDAYLPQLLPAVMTCIISRRLCESSNENHWELRDFSSSLLAFICNKYSLSYPQLLSQVVKVLMQSLSDLGKPLTSHYGALAGFSALGARVIQTAFLPNVANYVSLLKPELLSTNYEKKAEATKCYEKTMEVCAVYLIFSFTRESQQNISSLKTEELRAALSPIEHFSEYEKIFGDRLLYMIFDLHKRRSK